ncbi:MAG: hypothetical protein KGI78_01785 [Patescibacteria group bacterium]|nr:hypothetical protein [Patescibacteria group bacterium]MDE1944221.1 hypothetical protein [Patescibacteria group bacterium]MDE1945314.1 hypothetical protein [Patescibacteria group bacterium]MDE2057566.1 hypothetical protein [Patescibacteria group bacterium]
MPTQPELPRSAAKEEPAVLIATVTAVHIEGGCLFLVTSTGDEIYAVVRKVRPACGGRVEKGDEIHCRATPNGSARLCLTEVIAAFRNGERLERLVRNANIQEKEK